MRACVCARARVCVCVCVCVCVVDGSMYVSFNRKLFFAGNMRVPHQRHATAALFTLGVCVCILQTLTERQIMTRVLFEYVVLR